MQEQIERDLKTAMLAGEKDKAEVLKSVKSAVLNEVISQKLPRDNIDDSLIQKILAKESKARGEAAKVYVDAGAQDRADKELAEKKIIDEYLPQQMSEQEVKALVEKELAEVENPSMQDMGRVIGAVKAKAGASADGALIAKLVKEKLS